MSCNRTLRIGSVLLEEFPATPSNCYLWLNPTETLSQGDIDESETPNQAQHGINASLAWNRGRTLPFSVQIIAPDRETLVTKEQLLRKEVALPTDQDFTNDGVKTLYLLDEDGVEKQLYARIFRTVPDFTQEEDRRQQRRLARFDMRSEDDNIFSQTLTEQVGSESFVTTGFTLWEGNLMSLQEGSLPTLQESVGNKLSVTNSGIVATPPILIVQGPATNPVVENTTTGKTMTFNRNGGLTLGASDTLTINVATQSIIKTSSGVETNVKTTLALPPEWIYIDPGENFITVSDDTAGVLSTQVTVQFRSAWK